MSVVPSVCLTVFLMVVWILHMLLMVYHRVDRSVFRCFIETGTGPIVFFLVFLDPLYIVEPLLGVDLAVKDAITDGAEARTARIIWNKKR